MSSGLSFGDTRVKVNSFPTARTLRFLGAGVSVTQDVANNRFDITIAGGGGGGSGAVDDASNVGTAGVGLFKQLNVATLEFKKINAGAGGKVTITDDTGNDEVDIQVVDASTTQKGAVELATDGETTAGLAVQANDSRLSNTRTPTSHGSTHAGGGSDAVPAATTSDAGIVEFATSAETTAGLAIQASDTRLSDTRTPAAHNTSHQSGGSDAIKLDDLAATDDNTDLNASTLKHGLLRKLSGTGTEYLDGSGAWSTPAGAGGGGEGSGTIGGTITFSGDSSDTTFQIPHGLGTTPATISVEPSSVDALGDYTVDTDSTNITITYQSAPPTGTDNLQFYWMASVPLAGDTTTAMAKGNATKSGDATTKAFTIAHGMSALPVSAIVVPTSTDALGEYTTTVDATNITITYSVAPATGTDNLTYYWMAADALGGAIGSGEANTASNVGSGTGLIYKQKSGFDLQLKSLVQGTDIALTNGVSDITISNTVHTPYTFTIYQDASNYIVRNNHTGALQTFANTDFAPALEWTIDNIVNTGLGTQDSLFGGGIFIQRGKYTATTIINTTVTTATRHGITIEGEGEGTHIFINGTLTDGILIDMQSCHLRNMRITASSGVTNIIHQKGHGVGERRNDYCSYEFLMIEGPNGGGGMASGAITANQIGILIDGADPATFFSIVRGCKFMALEKGLWLDGLYATSCQATDNMSIRCEVGCEISNDAGQNRIDGWIAQGETDVGTTGVKVTNGAGGFNSIDNITAEMHKTGVASQAVLLESGTANTGLGTHISNSYDGVDILWKTVVDNSDGISRFYTDYVQFQPTQLIIQDASFNYNYVFNAGTLGATRIIDIPVATGPDALLFRDAAATVIGKTVNLTNNTITDSSTAAGDIPVSNGTKFTRKARGSANQFLKVNTGGTNIDYEALDVTLDANAITTTNTKTMSNKTLTTPTVNGVKLALPAAAKTANYTATATDYYIPVDANSGNLSVFLPAVGAGIAGTTYIIYKTDASANTVTIDPNASETINGVLTMTLRQRYQHIRVECTGTEWIATRDLRVTDDTVNDIITYNSTYLQFTAGQLLLQAADQNGNYLFQAGNLTTGTKIVNVQELFTNDYLAFRDAPQTFKSKTISDLKETWQSKSTTYSMLNTDYGIFLTGTSTYTVTLPTAASAGSGRIFKFLKTGASGTVTIAGNGAETVNGAANVTIATQYQFLELICDGSAWFSHRMSA